MAVTSPLSSFVAAGAASHLVPLPAHTRAILVHTTHTSVAVTPRLHVAPLPVTVPWEWIATSPRSRPPVGPVDPPGRSSVSPSFTAALMTRVDHQAPCECGCFASLQLAGFAFMGKWRGVPPPGPRRRPPSVVLW